MEYRALLIGEGNFAGTMYASRNYGNVELVAEMPGNVKTPGGTYYSCVRAKDINREKILSLIAETFVNADEDDVSLFYIATHGNVDKVGRYAGALSTVEVPGRVKSTLLFEDLTAALASIKGTKIVWIDACSSGSSIYDPDEENTADAFDGEYAEEEWEGWEEYEFNEGLEESPPGGPSLSGGGGRTCLRRSGSCRGWMGGPGGP